MATSNKGLLPLDSDTVYLTAIERRGDEIRAFLPIQSQFHIPRAWSDIKDFQKIISPDYQRFAATQISENIALDLAYADSFASAPDLPAGLTQKIADLNALAMSIESAKETRKASEMTAMMSDPALQRRIAESTNLDERALPVIGTMTGTHVGPITAISDGHVSQKIGRDPDQVVWHDVRKLRGSTPSLGQLVEISYSDGVGTVAAKGLAAGLCR